MSGSDLRTLMVGSNAFLGEQLKAPGQRALFVVCRSDGTHWNTDSRDWALLVYTSERCGSLGKYWAMVR